MSALSAQLVLASPGSNWTKIMLIGIFVLGLVLVILVPFTLDVINAHKSWRTIVGANPDALKVLKGPNGIQGLARATMALGLLVAIGFGLGYVLVEHPFSDNKPIVIAILSALTTAFASVTAFYFSTRAMQGAQQAQPAQVPPSGSGASSDSALAVTITRPQDSDAFTLNDAVNADYAVKPSAGAQVTSLKGTVDSGTPIDTTTLGEKQFVVSAKDSAGQEVEVSHTYTVNPPPA
jgi:hypothetical protein